MSGAFTPRDRHVQGVQRIMQAHDATGMPPCAPTWSTRSAICSCTTTRSFALSCCTDWPTDPSSAAAWSTRAVSACRSAYETSGGLRTSLVTCTQRGAGRAYRQKIQQQRLQVVVRLVAEAHAHLLLATCARSSKPHRYVVTTAPLSATGLGLHPSSRHSTPVRPRPHLSNKITPAVPRPECKGPCSAGLDARLEGRAHCAAAHAPW